MSVEAPAPSLEAELETLQRRNAWLERQLSLEKARVPENYAGRELNDKTIHELAQLTPKRQAELFWRMALSLNDARVAKTFVQAAEYKVVHNLEWNGEKPHPTWRELKVGFQRVSERVLGIKPTEISDLSSWTMMIAIRHDGTEDPFSIRNIPLPSFRDDRTPILPLKPDSEGRVDEEKLSQGVSQEKAAELLDFARGVRGGLQVLSTNYVPSNAPSSD